MVEQPEREDLQLTEIGRKPWPMDAKDAADLGPQEIQSLVQELRIHQAELDAQVEELKQIQEDLEQSRDKYQRLYDGIPIGYFTIDNNNAILEANASAATMLNTHKSPLIKSHFTEFVAPTPKFQDIFYLHTRQALGTGCAQECELEMQRSDGSRFYAHLQIVPSDTVCGLNNRLYITVANITERKQVEMDLLKARNELEKKVEEQVKRYRSQLIQVQEEERRRIAYDLHDDTAQYLSILKLQLNALLDSGKIQDPEVTRKLKYLEKDADRAFNDVRRFSHDLRPVVLEHGGLVAALGQIIDDINLLDQVRVELKVRGSEPELSEEIKLGLFRIVQESLNNIRKHSRASSAVVTVNFQKDRAKLMVKDNGIGFDTQGAATRSALKGSLGTKSMQERAKLIGANLKIESKIGKGTVVTLETPL